MTEVKWNDAVSLERAKAWIAEVHQTDHEIIGPIEVYRSNDWGITALFKVNGTEKQIVLKVAFLPIFQTSPAIYRLLSVLNVNMLPQYVAGAVFDNKTWLLFEQFKGYQVRKENTLGSLLEIGERMAELQKEAAPYAKEAGNIPVYDGKALSELLIGFIDFAKSTYLPVWSTKQKELVSKFGLAEHELEEICEPAVLDAMKPIIEEAAQSITESGIDLSIDHLDLHSNNAVRKEDGSLLIFDFEEAVISFPFFSLEKLLDEAESMASNYIGQSCSIRWKASQLELRDKYLNELIGSTDIRWLELFDLVMTVAPLKYAYQSRFFLQQVGWHEMEPALMAESFIKANRRINQLKNARTMEGSDPR